VHHEVERLGALDLEPARAAPPPGAREMTKYVEASVPDQSGRTVFVTGANTGIGYKTARVLCSKGARVMLGCRSEQKAKGALEPGE
jgi:NADPH:quinone reductase-like Zn-dependent oxidoreductase